jgi:hypothetical protein
LRSASSRWPFLALVFALVAVVSPAAAPASSSGERANVLRAIDRMGRAERAHPAASRPPYRSAWLCIQRHEGAWTDAGAPYYGGLQMDLSFQRTHAPALLRRKGTANRWTPLEQMWVAERALRRGTGFYPWPNAARLCGLL